MSSQSVTKEMPEPTVSSAWKFADSVPQSYQRYLVPVLFEPYAQDMARRVVAQTQGDVLETACGTGVVSRRLRAAMPLTRALIATDVSPGMLEVARASTPQGTRITWQQADACHLPFDPRQFGAVMCQFGMAFVPDPIVAMKEAWRVLAPGGTLYFSLWASPVVNLHSRLFDDVCQRFANGAIPAEDRERPYSLSEPNKLNQMLKQAGFDHIEIEALTLHGTSPSAMDLAKGAITGTPRARQLNTAGVDLHPVVEALAQELASHGGNAPCHLPMNALIATARKNDI